MIRSEARVDVKRRHLDSRRKQFANVVYKELDYPQRLNFYEIPPTAELSLEEFETWAIDRLRGKLCVILAGELH
jgi:DNA primase large subunit